ncbi:hypothetical protein Tco_0090298 [Tanacetum coccineum]
MSTYLKNMAGYKHTQLKNKSFEEIQMLLEKELKRVNIFVDMDAELVKSSETIESEVDRAVPELAAGSKEPRVKEADELSQEELQQMMIIVPEQGMNVEALQTKYPISDWEIYTEGTRNLVKEKFNSTEPTDDKEREIWVELKRFLNQIQMMREGNRHLHACKEGVSIIKRNSYIDAGSKDLGG